MNRPFLGVSLALGTAFHCVAAGAQPVLPTDPNRPASFSVVELEKFIGGRALIDVDLKDAPIEQVAAALSQASGQKIAPRPDFVLPANLSSAARAQFQRDSPAPRFTLAATRTPFWEALRGWQLQARRDNEAARAASKIPSARTSNSQVPNSPGLQRDPQGWTLQSDNALADGRAVAAWPFLVIATDLTRTQNARLAESGLQEIESPPDILSQLLPEQGAPQTLAAAAPVSEAERWSDRLLVTVFPLVDPKVTATGLRCEVEEAIDNKGNDLRLPRDAEARRFSSSYSYMGGSSPLQIALRSRPDMGKRLVKLRGVLRFSVVTRSQHWETTQLQTPVEDTIQQDGGDFKVKFEGVEKVNNGWSVNFTAKSQGAHLEQFLRNRVEYRGRPGDGTGLLTFEGVPRMRLLDENGREINNRMGVGSGTTSTYGRKTTQPGDAPIPTSIDASPIPPDAAQNWFYEEKRYLVFGAPINWDSVGGNMTRGANAETAAMGRPAKLIVDFPIERREISVPFEFFDLPLPPTLPLPTKIANPR